MQTVDFTLSFSLTASNAEHLKEHLQKMGPVIAAEACLVLNKAIADKGAVFKQSYSTDLPFNESNPVYFTGKSPEVCQTEEVRRHVDLIRYMSLSELKRVAAGIDGNASAHWILPKLRAYPNVETTLREHIYDYFEANFAPPPINDAGIQDQWQQIVADVKRHGLASTRQAAEKVALGLYNRTCMARLQQPTVRDLERNQDLMKGYKIHGVHEMIQVIAITGSKPIHSVEQWEKRITTLMVLRGYTPIRLMGLWYDIVHEMQMAVDSPLEYPFVNGAINRMIEDQIYFGKVDHIGGTIATPEDLCRVYNLRLDQDDRTLLAVKVTGSDTIEMSPEFLNSLPTEKLTFLKQWCTVAEYKANKGA